MATIQPGHDPRLPMPGGWIMKHHKGQTHVVKVLDDGRFEYEDRRYKSLSAIAQEITGANMDRPALRKLLQDVRDGLVDCVVVYKVDRLTLNILLSFAQFEREMIAERTRDNMSAARRKGRWVGGIPMLGYDLSDRGGALVVNEDEAARVWAIFDLYLEHGSLIPVVQELNRRGWRMKEWTTRKGAIAGGQPFAKNRLYNLLTNMVYVGRVEYGGQVQVTYDSASGEVTVGFQTAAIKQLSMEVMG